MKLSEKCCLDNCETRNTLEHSYMIGPTRYRFCSPEHEQQSLAKHTKASSAHKVEHALCS